MEQLDTNNAVPLYEQLRVALRERLDSGVLDPGERLPSETELCQKYGVSRITVRRAVDELVEEGILERRQGKGTFVAPKRRISIQKRGHKTRSQPITQALRRRYSGAALSPCPPRPRCASASAGLTPSPARLGNAFAAHFFRVKGLRQ